MRSQHYIPSPVLRPYIKYFWTIEDSIDSTSIFRFAPDGHPEIFFSLEGNLGFAFNGQKMERLCSHGLVGNFERNADIDTTNNQLCFNIKFHPHTLNALFPENCSKLINGINTIPMLDSLYEKLVDNYQNNKDIQSSIQIAETWLIMHFRSFPNQDLVANLSGNIQLNHKKPIQETLNRYGLSQRRLQQIFKEKVGIAPKQYQRLIRFRKAMNQLKQAPEKEEFIYSLGYHDWSHFCKDMSYYFGISPTDYVYFLFQQEHLINIRRS